MNLYSTRLPDGAIHLSSVTELKQKVAALLNPWLAKALFSGARTPLPLPAVAHFSATAEEADGGLLVDLWAPSGPYRPERPYAGPAVHLATIAIGRDDAAGQLLWSKMLLDAQQPWRKVPGSPWCAVLPDAEVLAAHLPANEWLADLADGLARAWLARPPLPREFQQARACAAADRSAVAAWH